MSALHHPIHHPERCRGLVRAKESPRGFGGVGLTLRQLRAFENGVRWSITAQFKAWEEMFASRQVSLSPRSSEVFGLDSSLPCNSMS